MSIRTDKVDEEAPFMREELNQNMNNIAEKIQNVNF
jgi:hypothetical protein